MKSNRICTLGVTICIAVTSVLTATLAQAEDRSGSVTGDSSDAFVAALGTRFMENQRVLGELKSWIITQPDALSSGYIDQVNDAENRSVRLLWSGESTLRAAALRKAAELGIVAVIEERPFTLSKISDVATAVFDHKNDIAAAGFTISSVVGVQADTVGIELEGDFITEPIGQQARDNVLASVKAVVTVIAGVPLEIIPGHTVSTAAGTRSKSTAPFYAGSYMIRQDHKATCSTGFAMKVGEVNRATTARHCDSGDGTFLARDGDTNFGSRMLTSEDGAMNVLTGTGAGRTFDNEWNNSIGFNKGVYNYYDAGLNSMVCTSGGNSGVHCNVKVTAADVYSDDGHGRFSNIRGEQQSSGGIAAIQGDSGGPVFVPYGGDFDQYVGASGIIQFVENGSTKDCGSVHDLGANKCSKTVLFSSIHTVDLYGQIGATLVTG